MVTKGVLSVSLHLRSRSVRVYSDLHNLCYLKKNSNLIFGILIISHPHIHARIQRAQGFCLNTSFPSLKKAYLRTGFIYSYGTTYGKCFNRSNPVRKAGNKQLDLPNELSSMLSYIEIKIDDTNNVYARKYVRTYGGRHLCQQ